jgi:hypothetical protein
MLPEHHARAKQLCRQGAFAGYTGDILTLDLASNALAPLDLGVNQYANPDVALAQLLPSIEDA